MQICCSHVQGRVKNATGQTMVLTCTGDVYKLGFTSLIKHIMLMDTYIWQKGD